MSRFPLQAILFSTLLLFPTLAFASPIISSADDQNFQQNQSSEQLLDITITDDLTTPVIKAGYITITIPESIAIIFDKTQSEEEVTLYGAAVDNGKLSSRPTVEFLDDDKTVKIPVLADLSAGESFSIMKLFVEGFNGSPGSSTALYMQINGEATQYEDTRDINIYTSSNEDNNIPETPANIQITAVEGPGVLITWTDPTDLDIQGIEILRGEGDLPPSGTPYVTVGAGVEAYLDTDVEEGTVVTYILRATDGRNYSALSAEYSWTVVQPTAEEETATEEVTETASDEIASEEDASGELEGDIGDEEGDTSTGSSTTFTDDIPSWAEAAVTTLAEQGVVEGNPDGTFAAGDDLNRAEAAAMLYRVLQLGTSAEASEGPFTDVGLGEWFTNDVAALKALGLVEGNPDGTYQPGESINRAEFLQLAMNIYQYLNPDLEPDTSAMTTTYADLEETAWYAQVVNAATFWGFVEGSACEEGTCFNASTSINRAEAAQILYKMFYLE